MTPALWHPFRGHGRRTLVALAMASLTSVLGLVSSGGAAQAATSPTSGGKSITFPVQMLRTASGQLKPMAAGAAVPAADEVIINYCTTQVNNPHESGHNPGAVNVTGTTTCSPYTFTESYLTIELFYNGRDYYWGQHYQADSLYNQANAAGPCYAGSWYAVLDYTIYFGPTWVPNEASGELVSNTVPITC